MLWGFAGICEICLCPQRSKARIATPDRTPESIKEGKEGKERVSLLWLNYFFTRVKMDSAS